MTVLREGSNLRMECFRVTFKYIINLVYCICSILFGYLLEKTKKKTQVKQDTQSDKDYKFMIV